MAEVTTNSQHLTELDLDISRIASQLKQVENQIAKTVKEIQTNGKYKVSLDVTYGGGDVKNAMKGQSEAIKSTTNALDGYAKVSTVVNKSGEVLSKSLKTNTNEFDNYVETIKKAKDGTETYTKTININNEARQKANAKLIEDEKNVANTVAKLEAEIKARDEKAISERKKREENATNKRIKQEQDYNSLYQNLLEKRENEEKKVANTVAKLEAEIKDRNEKAISKRLSEEKKSVKVREELEKNYSLLWNKLLDEREAKYVSTTRKIEDLISKQKQQINSLKVGKYDTSVIGEAEKNLKGLYSTQEKLSKQKIISSDVLSSVDNYERGIKTLDNTMKEAKVNSNSFLHTISDKARWLSAFYLIQVLQRGFFETVKVVKETEDATIELQRVLNDTSLGDTQIQTELYDIAKEYGRSFDEVSESAVKFAQTGASFNEALQLTEATMLAVNTAELDVATATTGLIAVMSQFQIKTSDMIDVIDKINITADNYAVTSEKIVSALQRFGSASKQANISLEQSIALITAMSEATGRSGETMGTAINSLLVYTKRDSALNIFAGLSEGMADLVDKYNEGSASIIDVWTELSKTLEGKQGAINQLTAGIASDSDYEQFASAIESDAQELVDEVEEVYGTAGTHRQNYLVAILKSMGTYENALKTMNGSENYSLKENQKAMETLTRQYQTLIESVKALAVEFGNAGFLDALKFMVNMGISATKLIESLGGLKTVLTVISTIIIKNKFKELKNVFFSIVGIVPKAISSIRRFGQDFSDVVSMVRKKSITASDGIKLLFGSMGNLATIAIGAVATAIAFYNQKMEKARQEAISYSSEINTQITELQTLKDTINEVTESTKTEKEKKEELSGIMGTLAEKYGEEKIALDDLNGAREKALDLIDAEIQKEYNKELSKNSDEMEKARKAMEKTSQLTEDDIPGFMTGGEGVVALQKDILESLSKFSKEYKDIIYSFNEDTGKISFEVFGEDTKSINQYTATLLADLKKRGDALSVGEQYILTLLESNYGSTDRLIEKNEEFYSTSQATQEASYKSLLENKRKAILATEDEAEKEKLLAEAMKAVEADAYKYGLTLKNIAEWLQASDLSIDEDGESFSKFAYNAEKALESIKGLNEQIDSTQSSFSTMYEAMEQYNSTGVLSIDMVQKLMALSGEYGAILSFQNGQLQMVDGSTGKLINSKNELIKQMIREQTTNQIVGFVASQVQKSLEDQAKASDMANTESQNLSIGLQGTINDMFNLGYVTSNTTAYLKEYAKEQGVSPKFIDETMDGINNIVTNGMAMYEQIGSIANSPETWGSSGINKVDESAKKANEARIKELETQKKNVEDFYNNMLAELEKVEKANDRLTAQEEYLKKLREGQRSLASAQARSGIEYREDEAEAIENLAETEKDWQKQLEKWSIEDKKAEIQALRDAEVSAIQSQIEALRNANSEMASSTVSSVGSAMSRISKSYSGTITQTSKETQEQAYETMNKIAEKTFDTYSDAFLAPIKEEYYGIFTDSEGVASSVFKKLYTSFRNDFVINARRDMDGIFIKQMQSYNAIRSGMPMSYGGNNETVNYNNSSRSMTNYMNINNSSDASKVHRQLKDQY